MSDSRQGNAEVRARGGIPRVGGTPIGVARRAGVPTPAPSPEVPEPDGPVLAAAGGRVI